MNIHQTKFSFLKKCFLKFSVFVFLFIVLFALASCREKISYTYTGTKLDERLFASISKSIADRTNLELEDEIEGCVFWTKSGTYYHLYKDCYYLARSNEIFLGTTDEADAEGKKSACSACLKKQDKETTTKPSNEENSPKPDIGPIFYWTASGSVYHMDPECHHLSKSKEIISGSLEYAISSGKESQCSSCFKSDSETTTKPDVDQTPTEDVVYWTKSGSVYHADKDCGYLSKSKEIISGTVGEAVKAEKTAPCSSCFDEKEGSDNDDITSDDTSTVYWTASGSVYHTSKDCSHIKSSKDIQSGSITEATRAGKEKCCSSCADGEKGDNNSSGNTGSSVQNPSTGVLYWTADGNVYHTSLNCSHLKSAKVVYYGNINEARKAGKTKLCSSCKEKSIDMGKEYYYDDKIIRKIRS